MDRHHCRSPAGRRTSPPRGEESDRTDDGTRRRVRVRHQPAESPWSLLFPPADRTMKVSEPESEAGRGGSVDDLPIVANKPAAESKVIDAAVIKPKPLYIPKSARVAARKSQARRHTLGSVSYREHVDDEETEEKREAFMDMLAKRYPQFACKIQDAVSEEDFPTRTPRPREQRRRTAVVTYNPSLNKSVEYDENGTMSDVEQSTMGSIQRGHRLRASLPIVRSASSSFERPLGLVFLVFKDETKKAALPNEITHLDTVWALFVHAFPDKLSMQCMESAKNKIYILDPKTNIYYQLEDLRDIKDRTVLKVHKCDSDHSQKVKKHPPVRGKTIISPGFQPPSRSNSFHGNLPSSSFPQQQAISKSKSLPTQNSRSYQQMLDEQSSQRLPERPRPTTPSLEMQRVLSMPAPTFRQQQPLPPPVDVCRYSPERQLSPDRPVLGTIPENRQLMQARAGTPPTFAVNMPGYLSNYQYQPSPQNYAPYHISPPRQYPEHEVNSYGHYPNNMSPSLPQAYAVKNVRTGPVIFPQRPSPVVQSVDSRDGNKMLPASRHSLAFVPMSAPLPSESQVQRTQSYRVHSEREPMMERSRSLTPQPMELQTKERMDKMEAQLANLAAWVHSAVSHNSEGSRTSSMRSNSSLVSDSTYNASTTSSLSDIPSNVHTSPSLLQPPINMDIKRNILFIKRKTGELRTDLWNLRRLQQVNMDSGHALFVESLKRIKNAMVKLLDAGNAAVGYQTSTMDKDFYKYREEEKRIDKQLTSLETSVEELRTDVISKQCRVNMGDVESMALSLSQISKAIAELKARFPSIQEKMKTTVSKEKEKVINEEKFLKEEPEKLENSLKRCKKLTGTLFTLKRLASVQERRPEEIPELTTDDQPESGGKAALPENPQSWVQCVETATDSRQRTKKLSSQQETLTSAGQEVKSTAPAKTVEAGPVIPRPPTPHKIVHMASPSKECSTAVKLSLLELATQKNAARADFFSSINLSSYKVVKSRESPVTTLDYVVRISPPKLSQPITSTNVTQSSESSIQQRPTPSHLWGNAESTNSVTSRASSNIPRLTSLKSSPASAAENIGSKNDVPSKKVPPPPPPRKSSRIPGLGVVSPLLTGTQNISKNAETPQSPKIKVTPLPPRKPISRFQQDIAAGIYANMNRPDLQSQAASPSLLLRKTTSPFSDSDRDSSPSKESGESTSSSDSQQSVVRKGEDSQLNGFSSKMPPAPPVRISSVPSFPKQLPAKYIQSSPQNRTSKLPLVNGKLSPTDRNITHISDVQETAID